MKAYKVTITTIIVTDGPETPDCWDIDRLMSEITEDTLADVGCVEMVESPARRYQGDPAADGAAAVRQDMRDAAAAREMEAPSDD